MTDTVAACRAALLTACESDHSYRPGVSQVPRYWVDVDDAAACMARAIRAAAEQPDMYLAVDAALAAAQEKP